MESSSGERGRSYEELALLAWLGVSGNRSLFKGITTPERKLKGNMLPFVASLSKRESRGWEELL